MALPRVETQNADIRQQPSTVKLVRGEESITALCRREGIAANLYYRWSKEFLEAGKKQLRPFSSSIFNLISRLSPRGDRELFSRPEMKAFFLDDLLTGSRWGPRAPVYDLLLFCRPWGFRLADIRIPIRFWHGDQDHLVPLAHAEHQAALIPDAQLTVRHGESHLGTLAAAEQILDSILALWPAQSKGRPRRRRDHQPRRRRAV